MKAFTHWKDTSKSTFNSYQDVIYVIIEAKFAEIRVGRAAQWSSLDMVCHSLPLHSFQWFFPGIFAIIGWISEKFCFSDYFILIILVACRQEFRISHCQSLCWSGTLKQGVNEVNKQRRRRIQAHPKLTWSVLTEGFAVALNWILIYGWLRH